MKLEHPVNTILTANKNTYIGVFFTTLSILIYEILLTRIFSVIAYYHFAFMAISLAMFGMTFGAILVYLLPVCQKNEKVHQLLAYASLLFSVSIVISFLILLSIHLQFNLTWAGILLSMCTFLMIAGPFIFGGISICLALTRFSSQVSKLYAIDLLGASLGCFIVIILLNTFSASTVLFITAIFAGVSAIVFSKNISSKDVKYTSIAFTIIFCLLAGSNIALEKFNLPLFRFSWIKNQYEPLPLYEKWNSFSRLTITGDPLVWHHPFGWGFSNTLPKNIKSRFLTLTIDGSASTPLTYYQNNINDISYLKYDVTNIAHYLRANANILIIGVGGGRDILSALVFNQHSIDGVEINHNILNLLTHQFSDYLGGLNQNSRLKLINDEARSFITRSQDKYDIIQMSLIDTWAATTAGAFALSENALYTTQSWQLFMEHLSPHGLLSVSRWFYSKKPAEMYRLTVLAREVLKNIGAPHPEKNMMVFSSQTSALPNLFVATMLVSPQPFSDNDIKTALAIANKLHYKIILAPSFISDPVFASLASAETIGTTIRKLAFNLTAPTDDKPFFFQMINLKSIFNFALWKQDNYFAFNSQAVVVLGVLLITVTLLTMICIFTPLFFTLKKNTFRAAGPLLAYFASIGLGFMFIEISQIQRLTLFLGHPTYGLSVVLFTLLLSSGLGSLMSARLSTRIFIRAIFLIFLLLVLYLFALTSSNLILYFQAAATVTRILIACLMLFPMGFCMGFALPLGMQLATMSHSQNLSPWLWSINGCMSICGSVFAIAIAFTQGISQLYWAGVTCYVVAFIAYCLHYLFSKNLTSYLVRKKT